MFNVRVGQGALRTMHALKLTIIQILVIILFLA
jgi:hypothetical protein